MRKVSYILKYELRRESISSLGGSKYLGHLVYHVIQYHFIFNIFRFYCFFPATMSQKCMQQQKQELKNKKVCTRISILKKCTTTHQ